MRVITGLNLMLASAILAITGLSGGLTMGAQSPETELAGYVVSDAGTPVKYASVQLYATQPGGSNSRSTLTDREGHFSFVNLPPGTYRLNVYQPGYVQPHQTGDPPLEVVIEEGQELTDLELVLMRGGVITGSVRDEDGDPIVNTLVTASRKQEDGHFQRIQQVQTDDRGVYRIYGLPPGEYIVASRIPQHSGQGLSHGLIYFPGVPSWRAARLLSVAGGAETTGIDIRIEPSRGARLTGRVTLGATKEPIAGLRLSLYGERMFLSATTRRDGRYTFANLPAGTFHLRIDPANHNVLSLRREVKITSAKPTRLDIEMEAGGQISGFLELTGDRIIPSPRQIMVNAQWTSTDRNQSFSGGSRAARVDSDGSFVVSGLPSARVTFSVRAPNNRYFLRSVFRGDDEVPEGQLTIKAGEELTDVRLILSDEVGEVRGVVEPSDDQVIPYQMVLVPTDESQWPDSRSYRYAWSNGQQPAVIQGVPAGHYLLFALGRNVGFGGQTFIREHRSRAIELEIRPDDVLQVEVEPITLEELGIRR